MARRKGGGRLSPRLARNADAVSYLMRAPSKVRQNIVKHAPSDLIASVCECVYNVLNGNIPASQSQTKTLYKHRSALRRLVGVGDGKRRRRKETLSSKKRILTAPQSGGIFLPLIGKLLLPMLGGLLGGG